MEAATLNRPPSGPDTRARLAALPWPGILLAALALGVLVAFFLYPTYPNYDSYYSLIWGRELIHGQSPSFDVYRAPTEHPLAVFLGALLSLLGDGADRVLVFLTMASFVVLIAGMYRLGRLCFTRWVGLLAAALLLTRFDFPFLALRAYIDVPYLAVVIWAAALEVARPRRGMPVLVLLVLAGLMRPEAWLLIGLYFLWIAWPATWAQRIRYALVSAIAPVVWVGLDWAVTGKPLFSLQHTSGLAEELGRSKGIAEVPGTMAHFLLGLDKPLVLDVGVLGLLVAIVLFPRRIFVPLALLVIGLGTFLLVGVGGFSVIDRYLLVASLMVMVFAAVMLGGWTMLRHGRLRTAWMWLSFAAIAAGLVFSVGRFNFEGFEAELVFRDQSHQSLAAVLRADSVTAARRCGPVSTPNHKLLPDARWILNAGPDEVLARADPAVDPLLPRNRTTSPLLRGVALIPSNRLSVLRQTFTTSDDETLNALAPPGFRRIATGRYYGAYARC